MIVNGKSTKRATTNCTILATILAKPLDSYYYYNYY